MTTITSTKIKLTSYQRRKQKSVTEQRGDALKQLNELGRVSLPNAALLLGIHVYTMRGWVASGKAEAIFIGARQWIFREELQRLQQANEQEMAEQETPT